MKISHEVCCFTVRYINLKRQDEEHDDHPDSDDEVGPQTSDHSDAAAEDAGGDEPSTAAVETTETTVTILPRYHLSRDDLKHFYLPNPFHQFNFYPCNLCTVS